MNLKRPSASPGSIDSAFQDVSSHRNKDRYGSKWNRPLHLHAAERAVNDEGVDTTGAIRYYTFDSDRNCRHVHHSNYWHLKHYAYPPMITREVTTLLSVWVMAISGIPKYPATRSVPELVPFRTQRRSKLDYESRGRSSWHGCVADFFGAFHLARNKGTSVNISGFAPDIPDPTRA